MPDFEKMAEQVVKAAEAFVTRAVAAITYRVDALAASIDQRFAALPVPKDGAPGTSAYQLACLGGFAGSEGEWMESLRGKDADPELVRLVAAETLPGLVEQARAMLGEQMYGHAVPAAVAEAVAAEVAKLPPAKAGKDAEPVHPDTLALMVVTEVAKAVERAVGAIPKAKDGEPGRDAIQCEPLLSIDEAKSYPRGTYAAHRGGTIRSFRQTDPIGEAGLQTAGWAVMQNGIESESEVTSEDGRQDWRQTLYTDGTELVRTIARAVVIDRGVWREGAYQKGDGTTFGGSFWIAQQETLPAEKPGESDAWRLSVKRGRDGADKK